VAGSACCPAVPACSAFPAHLSDDDKYLVINDEAFGCHTCNNHPAVDLYRSRWIYGTVRGALIKDRTAELIPRVLPARPAALRDPQGGGFCVIPGRDGSI
jgi:hypothetical protein